MAGIMRGQSQIMAYHEQSKTAFVARFLQNFPKQAFSLKINARLGLVKNKQIRFSSQSKGKEHSPGFSSGKLSQAAARQAFRVNKVQKLPRTGVRGSIDSQPKRPFLKGDGKKFANRKGKRTVDMQLLGNIGRSGMICGFDPAGIGFIANKAMQQRCLPGPVGANQNGSATGGNMGAQIVNDHPVAFAHTDVIEFHCRRGNISEGQGFAQGVGSF